MIYINSHNWRIGNQLFEAACAAGLAVKNNDTFVIPPGTKYNQFLKNPLPEHITPEEVNIVYKEPFFHYQEIPYQKDMAISGYWQSWKYFEHCQEYVRELFQPKDEIKNYLIEKFSHLINDEKICSIHIRRGDYVNLIQSHPPVSLNYILKTVKQFPKDYKFVVLSDDIAWCKEQLQGDKFIFIEPQEDIKDFYLMSMLHNNIIANSSFSWWSAALNTKANTIGKVVAPKQWFGPALAHNDTKDLYPEGWIII